ncbi:DUF262 domain-containing protein [Gordonibacter pamelaeae]|uniref:DUF262 domain-containing protein n=1 Tax=Gordonibacter pamelaeae TaxID=471189 RepID=UPI00242A37AF|nr:DUF262 domain-containing protein [Gordonibacter pamelaeae]
MGSFADGSMTIYEAVKGIEAEGYVMPAFQRDFVWTAAQIEKLWDSILLDYPISTFLFWHIDESNTDEETYFCDFLKKVVFNFRGQSDSTNYELIKPDLSRCDTAVLDGQQRLTSLYISLLGETFGLEKYARRKSGSRVVSKLVIELDEESADLDESDYNSLKHDIRFNRKVGKLSPTHFEIKKVMSDEFRNKDTRKEAIEASIVRVRKHNKDKARQILEKLCQKVHDEPMIRYTLIKDMTQDDALEMFVRFNSGGKALSKSDITMAILEAYWPSARSEFGKVLVGEYANFGNDFIIRAALMLFGDVVKSNINETVARDLKNNWEDFKKSLAMLENLLAEMDIKVERFSSSWNVLLPIIYFIYQNPLKYKDHIEDIEAYLTRALLFRFFQSGTTGKLQQLRNYINEYDFEITVEMLEQMNDLRVTQARIDDILDAEKGSGVAGEALYLLNREWSKSDITYHQDHLHPEDRFSESKPSGVSAEEWSEWRSWRNRLANLQLLEGRLNESKNDMSLLEYFNDMNDDQQAIFVKRAILPADVPLDIGHFGDFYKQRRALLEERILSMLK